jgi:hypothetical protein
MVSVMGDNRFFGQIVQGNPGLRKLRRAIRCGFSFGL